MTLGGIRPPCLPVCGRCVCVCVCEREECLCAGGEGIISMHCGGFSSLEGAGGLSSSIFHGFSPFRSAASHTRLTGPFSFISRHLWQTRRARGSGRLLQEAAATRVRGDAQVFFPQSAVTVQQMGVQRCCCFKDCCI